MRKRFTLSAAVIAAIALCLSSATAETVIVRDKLERMVSIDTPVKRAVFFQTYELIPALGIWDKVAGIGRYAYSNDLMRTLKPDIAQTIPSAGSGIDINIEALMKLKPDLVITWTSKPENISFMEARGLSVYAMYPDSLQELYDVMLFHGRIFDRKKRMSLVIGEMERIFRSIRRHVAAIPLSGRKKVLWISSRPTSVACGVGVTQDIFTMIGGVNPAAGIQQRNAEMSVEKIVAWDPDVIFIWGNAKYTAQDIFSNSQWRFIRAVKNGRVYKAPEWSTWSPRIAPIALWMAMRTYPEYFKDVNLDKVTDNFYRKTYGISYAQVKRIEN